MFSGLVGLSYCEQGVSSEFDDGGKRVRFHADHARIKVRPTHTNLRPLERLVKKSSKNSSINGLDGTILSLDGGLRLVKSLQKWDSYWRNYLYRYYYDDMMLRVPLQSESLKEMSGARTHLDQLSQECMRLYSLLPGRSNLDIGMNSTFYWKLLLRQNEEEKILLQIIESVCSWTQVEHNRWEVSTTMDLKAHQNFCEFVDQLETYQKKFKSIIDGIRRIVRKANREIINHHQTISPTNQHPIDQTQTTNHINRPTHPSICTFPSSINTMC